MRRSGVIALAVAALAMSACGGPKAPFDVGTQAAPVDLVLGEREAVEEFPIGPLTEAIPESLAPFFPISAPPAKQEPLGPCPDFDPLAPIAPGVTSLLTGAPPRASYAYRAKTTETIGQTKQQFAGDSTWNVSRSYNPQTGGFEVTVETVVGPVKSKRVFGIFREPVKNIPALDDPALLDLNAYTIDQYNGTVILLGLPQLDRSLPALGFYGPPGIYLLSQTMGDETFTPLVPIPLLYSPIYQRNHTAFGTDGKTVMQFDAKSVGTDYVNACGTKIETTKVELTNGKVSGRNDKGEVISVDFTETIHFGIQFGGLPVRDEGKVSASSQKIGSNAKTTISRTFEYTTNAEPKLATR